MKKIIFFHIPKTGGTTLHTLLTNEENGLNFCSKFRHNDILRQDPNVFTKYDFFSGHFRYSTLAEKIDLSKFTLITMLRHPVDRIISMYRFGKSHSESFIEDNPIYSKKPECYWFHGMCYRSAKLLTFKDFLKQDFEFLQDFMVKQLSISSKHSLDSAVEGVDRMDYVGVLDYIGGFYAEMCEELGFKKLKKIPKILDTNERPENNESLDKNKIISIPRIDGETFDILSRIVKNDMILYLYCKELCISRLEKKRSLF